MNDTDLLIDDAVLLDDLADDLHFLVYLLDGFGTGENDIRKSEYNLATWFIANNDWKFMWAKVREAKLEDDEDMQSLLEEKAELDRRFSELESHFSKEDMASILIEKLSGRVADYFNLSLAIETSDAEEVYLIVNLRTEIQALLEVCQGKAILFESQLTNLIFADENLRVFCEKYPKRFLATLENASSQRYYPKSHWWWYLAEN